MSLTTTFPKQANIRHTICCFPFAIHAGHVSADAAEDVVDDHDAAVDEEEEDDEDEVLVEEDQMQATVCIASVLDSDFAIAEDCVLANLPAVFPHQEGGADEEADEYEEKPLSSHPDADTIIVFTTGEGW